MCIFFFFFFLLSATNSFAFSRLFLKPAVESGCGLDQNYIVEDELPPFFFNYPKAWPPLVHQATPAVRLNSLVLFPSPHHRKGLVCSALSKVFVWFFFFVVLYIFIRK